MFKRLRRNSKGRMITASGAQLDYKVALEMFYNKHDPSKLANVDNIVDKVISHVPHHCV
jgi:hypothetical protein